MSKLSIKLSSKNRGILLIGLDCLISCTTLLLAFSLKAPLQDITSVLVSYWWLFPLISGIRIGTFQNFGMYASLWRYASIKELENVIKAISLSSLIIMMFLFVFNINLSPRILFIDWALNIICTGGFRIVLRMYRDHIIIQRNKTISGKRVNLLLIGAGDAGEMISREILRVSSLKYHIVGFVDDQESILGQNIHQIPVLGTTKDIPKLSKKYDIEEAIIAIPSARGATIRRILTLCEDASIKSMITPGLYEIIGGRVSINQIREVRIEDLLGRDVVKTDISSISRYLSGSTVLITGAGGSIGSELSRQILDFSPKKLIIIDVSENNMYQIKSELSRLSTGEVQVIGLVGDVRNRKRLRDIFELYTPQIVFHAAAYKHVPLMEENISEVVENNVLGTQNVLDLAKEFKASECVLISTDKAVYPTSCMGATKRLGEIIMQIASDESKTKFSAVRFGNVLGSTGSVVPLFKRQISEGGPLTVTHPDVTRFFMTTKEAVSLVIQAGALSTGGEIFILDMGEPVKIIHLARDMIHLSGLEEGKDIEIKFIGLRAGEKLEEELMFNKEGLKTTQHQKIFITEPVKMNRSFIKSDIQSLIEACGHSSDTHIKNHLFSIVKQAQTIHVKASFSLTEDAPISVTN
ncbi:MAG: polysaccharide biosynthesis protein [Candidatus Margulisbacteria bacterium]|nr:polysaccharide biosynthesis protein [Candidatus Margulisiibacteriota bacterium]